VGRETHHEVAVKMSEISYSLKRPTTLVRDGWGWSFNGVHGTKIGPMDLDNARVSRISELERYIDYLEETTHDATNSR
jgi:hypothetical protein